MSDALNVLLSEITRYLRQYGSDQRGVDQVLRVMDSLSVVDDFDPGYAPSVPAGFAASLDTAISAIPSGKLTRLATAIDSAKHLLHWRKDAGLFYSQDANVGQGFLDGNLHCLIAAPEGGVLHASDFNLGFFLLNPYTFYRDHNHPAPELYLNLTGPVGWRFKRGVWQDLEAGSIVWNEPLAVHATRVYDTPFLSVFSWTSDVNKLCNVIPSDDWDSIEHELRSTNI